MTHGPQKPVKNKHNIHMCPGLVTGIMIMHVYNVYGVMLSFLYVKNVHNMRQPFHSGCIFLTLQWTERLWVYCFSSHPILLCVVRRHPIRVAGLS
jgi:hypothetical protein